MTTTRPQDPAARRQAMVRDDIAGRGVRDRRVLDAMARVPRELFVPDGFAALAYDDGPLPIGEGQTISQPFIVALMIEAAGVGPGDRVLEIGTGSGYSAAVLAEMDAEVWTIERHAALAGCAADALRLCGCDRVHVIVGDGTIGLADEAPFDVIIVTAGGPTVPATLIDQLRDGGCLVMPVGSSPVQQELVRVTRVGDGTRREDLGSVRFVPLIGREGWGP